MFGAEATPGLSGAEYGIVGVVLLALLGALLWFMRHVVVTTIPALEDRHARTIEGITGELRESRQQFREMIRFEQEYCQQRHDENQRLNERIIAQLAGLQRAAGPGSAP